RAGEQPEDRIGLGLEVHSLRDHRPGEDARSIHWKSTARAGRLIAVDREQERRKRICVVLDHRTLRGDALERAVELAAAVVVRESILGSGFHGRVQWAWTLLLGGALLVLAAQVFAGQVDVVLAAAVFAELLCIHRLWHRRTGRDEVLLLLLSLLLLCAGAAL